MLSLSNSWGKYGTQTPIKSCATSVAATVQITVLLAIKIFFFSITPKYVPKMFFNLLFHNKAGTCLCSRSMAGGRKGNFLMFAQQTRLKLQPPRKNSSVSSIRAMQKPAGTAAAHPQKEEHIIHESYGTQGHNTPSQGISLLPKAGKRYQLHLTRREMKHLGLEQGVCRGQDTGHLSSCPAHGPLAFWMLLLHTSTLVYFPFSCLN